MRIFILDLCGVSKETKYLSDQFGHAESFIRTGGTSRCYVLFNAKTWMPIAVERRLRRLQGIAADIAGFNGDDCKVLGILELGLSYPQEIQDFQGIMSYTSFCLDEGIVKILQFNKKTYVREYLTCDQYSNNWRLVYPLQSNVPKWMEKVVLIGKDDAHQSCMQFSEEFKKLSINEKEKLCLTKTNVIQNLAKKFMNTLSNVVLKLRCHPMRSRTTQKQTAKGQ